MASPPNSNQHGFEHLDEQRLQDYLNGSLPIPDAQEVNEHLEKCSSCQSRLEGIENEKTESQKKATLASIRNSLGSLDATLVHDGPEVALTPNFDTIPFVGDPTALTKPKSVSQADFETELPGSSSPIAALVNSGASGRLMDIGSQLGPYCLEAKLGEGGMGAVYKAKHTKLDKTVALKVLAPQFTKNSGSVARFEREMKAVGKLDHPQIVRAMDAGEIDGIHYLAMEFVDGNDLQALVRSRGPLSVVNACKAVRQASQALAAAHAAGLVHRDIKPANLILAKNGQMKVLDLGLALLGDDSGQNTELTTAGQTFGTPDYMAPEQWEDTHTSDGRVDLYALGCTLFFLLTGRAPYATEDCKTFVAKMKAHVTAPIPDLKGARKDVPDGVVAVYQKLMAKLPGDRFQSASELAAALLPLSSTKQTAPQPVAAVPVAVATSTDATHTDNETQSDSLADAISELPELGSPKTPLADSLFINTEAFSKPGGLNPLRTPQMQLSPKTSSSGRNIIPKKIFLACGGAFAALLLGIIVITIRNQDGSETVIKVQEGSTIELKTDPGSKVTIAQQNSDTKSTSSSDGVKQSDALGPTIREQLYLSPLEYAEERSVAEWILSLGGTGQVRLADGNIRDLKSAFDDPSLKFVSVGIELTNAPIMDDDLRRFSSCKHLETLNLSGNRINGTGLKHLKAIATLTHLRLEGQVDSNGKNSLLQDHGLIGLIDLPQLTHLSLCFNAALADKSLDHVSKLTKLKHFETNGMGITDSGLEKLDSLTELCEFDFCFLPFVTDQGVRRFLQKHPLLKNTKIDNAGPDQTRSIEALANAKELERLQVSYDQLIPNSLRVINSLPKLSEIGVNAPTDDNILTLLQIGNLKHLQLNRFSVGVGNLSDDSYLRLAKYSSIESLVETGSDNSPTDGRLLMLAQSPTLKSLSVHFYDQHEPRRYTDAGIAKLRERRPDLMLTVDGKKFPFDPNANPLIELAKVEPLPRSILEAKANAPAKVAQPKTKGIPKSPGPSVKQLGILNTGPTMLKLKPGTPISSRALVGAPLAIKELASWSIEPRGHLDHTGGIDIHPDGTRIATVGMVDASIRIWEHDAANPKNLLMKKIVLGETVPIFDLAWSHSGEFIAVACNSGRGISIYEPASGRLIRQVPLKIGANQLAWSPNDRFIVALSFNHLFLVDLGSGEVVSPKIDGSYSQAVWSPDGSQFVTLGVNGNVRFWNSATVEILSDNAQPTYAGSDAIAWSPDGSTVVVGNQTGNIAVWDPVLRKVTREISVTERQPIMDLAWEPLQANGKPFTEHGSRLLINSSRMQIYDNALTKPLLSWTLDRPCYGQAWSPDGETVTLAVHDRPLVFDSRTAELLSQPEFTTPGLKYSNNLSADGKTLRVIEDTDLLLFDAETGDFIKRVANMPSVRLLAAPKDDWLVCFDLESEDHQIYFVDTATYERRVPLNEHSGRVKAVNWSPSGQFLASCGADKTVKIWKPGKTESVLTIPHQRAVNNVIWSPDGQQLATCTDDSIIRLWDSDKGTLIREYPRLASPPEPGLAGIAWSPNASVIAIAPRSAQAVTLDLRTGLVSEPIISTNSALTDVAWSPDGKQIVAANGANGSEIGFGQITGKSLPVVHGHGTPIQWLSDNRRLLSGPNGSSLIQALDVRRGSRLGTLIPKTASGGWICIGADGHYRGSEGIEAEFVFVALHKDGSQTIHTPAEFQQKFDWNNDPQKVTFLKLRDRAK